MKYRTYSAARLSAPPSARQIAYFTAGLRRQVAAQAARLALVLAEDGPESRRAMLNVSYLERLSGQLARAEG